MGEVTKNVCGGVSLELLVLDVFQKSLAGASVERVGGSGINEAVGIDEHHCTGRNVVKCHEHSRSFHLDR